MSMTLEQDPSAYWQMGFAIAFHRNAEDHAERICRTKRNAYKLAELYEHIAMEVELGNMFAVEQIRKEIAKCKKH